MNIAITRKRLNAGDKLAILARQAACPLCGSPLGELAACDFDHETALVNGGADSVENLRAVHRDCHKQKTFGPGGTSRISSRNSDISEPLRLDRIAVRFRADMLKPRERGAEREKKTAAKSKWPSRPFQKKVRPNG